MACLSGNPLRCGCGRMNAKEKKIIIGWVEEAFADFEQDEGTKAQETSFEVYCALRGLALALGVDVP